MKKIIKYKTVIANSWDIDGKVNNLTNEGWQPYGHQSMIPQWIFLSNNGKI